MLEKDEASSSEGQKEKILEEARSRFKLAEEAERDTRSLFVEDMNFRAGEQWDAAIKSSRQLDNRPCLVINKIPQSIQQVVNDQRQNRPSIKVHPVDDRADVETGKVIQGLIRHIEYNSNADVAYDRAFDTAVSGGFGYFGFYTDYVDSESFDQEIKFRSIPNPLSVYFDPHSQEPDGSDAKWAFIIDKMSRDEFKARYPDAELSTADDWKSFGDDLSDWMEEDTVRVAEYFYKEISHRKIVLLRDETGETRTVLAKDLPQVLPTGVEVLRTRMAPVPTIKWCKINGVEILEETEWPGIYIPIVPVYGNEINANGTRILEGIVRNAKDSQRMYNYWASAETEAIALAPRAPYIAAEGQIEGYEVDWRDSNKRNISVLKYKPTSVNGKPVAPPQRNAFEPAVQAITQARMLASEDMKATTGIYDASLGAKSNETSGVAIQRRNVQAQTSNFHFVDNLTRSLRHAGRILIDLIPKIYDTPRVARIIGEDGEERIVKVNDPEFVEKGKKEPALYDITAGKYDITVDVGPSFASKRQEAVESMLEVIRAYPNMAQVASDLLVKNMDWPGAQEIADRLKKTLPPGLADDNGEEIPAQAKAQLQQQGAMIEDLTKALNEAEDTLDKKRQELESKERIEMRKLEVELEIERAKLDAGDSRALLDAELRELDRDQDFQRQQSLDPANGANSAGGQPHPTGGDSPGTHMEGN